MEHNIFRNKIVEEIDPEIKNFHSKIKKILNNYDKKGVNEEIRKGFFFLFIHLFLFFKRTKRCYL
jgi:hypothetical protein